MEAPLLSDLCSSCHAQEPRYRCPRCKARTCSLDCYKRHQQRASCSGKRDPTSYVKRSKWATAGGVDHDFNYLRAIERHIDDTNTNLSSRGIDKPPKKSKPASRAWLPGGPLDRYLRQHNITVQHAPTGMSRQKTNLTRETKSGKVVWTVEWIDDTGVKRRQDDCLASNAVADLYHTFEVQMRNVEKRRLHPERLPAKRRKVPSDAMMVRRFEDLAAEVRMDAQAVLEQSAETYGSANESAGQSSIEHSSIEQISIKPMQHAESDASSSEPRATDPPAVVDLSTREQSLPLASPEPLSPNQTPVPSEIPAQSASPAEQQQAPPRFFYLHKPVTTTVPTNPSKTTLIPVPSTTTLTNALRTRLVQEYPTIYVLSHSPATLPDYFILDEDNNTPTSVPSNPSSSSTTGETSSWDHRWVEPARGDRAALPPSAILDLLRRDVAAYMQTGGGKTGSNDGRS